VTPQAENAVTVRDVFCLYPAPRGHVAALRGLTLDVAPGERVLVHGPNGSGKSTLLKVLAGQQAPSAGMVRVCGVDLVGAGERDRVGLRAHRLGLIDQAHGRTLRPELSVRENVALQLRLTGSGVRAARRAADELLDQLGLGQLGRRRPATLSGGEAQRVAVCAAVAHRPTLVLADEPTGELDRESAAQVHDLLVAVCQTQGSALLLVSHDTQAERIVDRVVRVRDGRLSEEWHAGDAGAESLVVDDRGWVRLPEQLRRRVGAGTRLRAATAGATIVLRDPTSPTAADEPAPVAPAMIVHNGVIAALAGVTIARDGRRILDGQSLDVHSGGLTVVSGRSGSGKTTLLRILTGLDRPDAGSVRIGDVDLATVDREGLARLRRRSVAVAGQSTALLETLDVTENLELARQVRGLPAAPEVVGRWLTVFGLDGVRHRTARLLSGGERQRVALARAFVAEPTLAVLDEPTSQQDEANAERIVAALTTAVATGTAVVAATHDPVLAAAATATLTLS
jgi:ABC-type lipoprotein export system ATPase subunit